MGHSASKSRLTIFFQVAKFSTCLLYYNYFPFSTCIVHNFSVICKNITGKAPMPPQALFRRRGGMGG